MLLKELVKQDVSDLTQFLKEPISKKYIYFDKSNNKLEVRIKKYNIRVSFDPSYFDKAIEYRDFIVRCIENGYDITTIQKPSNGYRGVKSKRIHNTHQSFNHNFKIMKLVTSNDDFIVTNDDESVSYRFMKSRKKEAQRFIDECNKILKSTNSYESLRKPNQFETGKFDKYKSNRQIRQILTLLDKLTGDLSSSTNMSKEKYISHDKSSYQEWRVLIKLGNEVLVDTHHDYLRDAITQRSRAIKALIPILENRIIEQIKSVDY